MNQHFEDIERYINGELNETELNDFEEALQHDQALKDSAFQYREMKDRLEALRIRKKVKSILLADSDKKTSSIFNLRLLSIAASITIAIIAIWFLYPIKENSSLNIVNNTKDSTEYSIKETTDTIVNSTQYESSNNKNPIPEKKKNNFNPVFVLVNSLLLLPNELSLRSIKEDSELIQKTEFELALLAHSKKDYVSALLHLNKLEIIQTNDDALYLRGVSYFKTQQYIQSLKDFNLLSHSLQYKQEAFWNQLLTLIMLGNKKEVDQSLKIMIEDNDFPYRENALKIKEKLKNLDTAKQLKLKD